MTTVSSFLLFLLFTIHSIFLLVLVLKSVCTAAIRIPYCCLLSLTCFTSNGLVWAVRLGGFIWGGHLIILFFVS